MTVPDVISPCPGLAPPKRTLFDYGFARNTQGSLKPLKTAGKCSAIPVRPNSVEYSLDVPVRHGIPVRLGPAICAPGTVAITEVIIEPLSDIGVKHNLD